YTGLQSVFELRFRGPVAPALRKIRATVKYDMPGRSFNTYLATTPIDPNWVFRRSVAARDSIQTRMPPTVATAQQRWAPETLLNEPATVRQRKAYALAHLADRPYVDKRQMDSTFLYDDGTHGDSLAGDGV